MRRFEFLVSGLVLFLLGTVAAHAQPQNEVARCFSYLQATDYARAIQSGQKATRQTPNDLYARLCLGRAHKESGELKSALREFKEVERLATTKKDLGLAYNWLGSTYSSAGDFENAFLSYNRALTLARDRGDRSNEATELNNLALIFRNRGDLDKALDYFNQSLNLQTDEREKAATYNNIALIHGDKGDYPQAIRYYEKAIAIHHRAGDYHRLALTKLNLGSTYVEAREFAKAQDVLAQGLAGVLKVGDKYWEAVAYKYQAWLSRDLGDLAQAKALLTKAHRLAKSIGAQREADDIASTFLAIEKREKTRYYAGIEIGAKGVKASVVAVLRGKDGDTQDEEIFNRSLNTTIVSGMSRSRELRPEAIEETAQAVKTLLGQMTKAYEVPEPSIYVAASTAVAEASNRFALTNRIRELTGKETKYISLADEVFYGVVSTMPAKDMRKGLSIDVGSGNTKIGYVVPGAGRLDTVAIGVPFGSVTLTEAVRGARREGEGFGAAAERYAREKLAPDLAAKVQAYPALDRRDPVSLVGGAVWAMATLVYPERQTAYVRIAPGDIRKYYDLLVTNPGMATDPSLLHIKDEKTRKRAAAQIEAVNKTFTRENLIAGAAILRLLVDEMKLGTRELYFSRYGGWLYGYVALAGIEEEKGKEKQRPISPPAKVPRAESKAKSI